MRESDSLYYSSKIQALEERRAQLEKSLGQIRVHTGTLSVDITTEEGFEQWKDAYTHSAGKWAKGLTKHYREALEEYRSILVDFQDLEQFIRTNTRNQRLANALYELDEKLNALTKKVCPAGENVLEKFAKDAAKFVEQDKKKILRKGNKAIAKEAQALQQEISGASTLDQERYQEIERAYDGLCHRQHLFLQQELQIHSSKTKKKSAQMNQTHDVLEGVGQELTSKRAAIRFSSH